VRIRRGRGGEAKYSGGLANRYAKCLRKGSRYLGKPVRRGRRRWGDAPVLGVSRRAGGAGAGEGAGGGGGGGGAGRGASKFFEE